MLVSLEEKGAEREEMLLKIEIASAKRLGVEIGKVKMGLMTESGCQRWSKEEEKNRRRPWWRERRKERQRKRSLRSQDRARSRTNELKSMEMEMKRWETVMMWIEERTRRQTDRA